MKKIKSVIFTLALFAAPLTVYANDISVTGDQTVILDGQVLLPAYPLIVVNDRLMVPLRSFADAMDAQITWEENIQQVSVFRDGRFSFIRIGNSIIQSGEYTINNFGERSLGLVRTGTMDAPAIIFADRTYIPLRAVSESLGASIEWIEQSSTAVIISTPQASNNNNQVVGSGLWSVPIIGDPSLPSGGASNVNDLQTSNNNQNIQNQTQNNQPAQQQLPENYGDFSNTSHFTNITSRQASARHQDSNDHPFILVVYNSDSHHSRMVVPNIQDAAQRARIRVFGLDRYTNNPQNNEADNSWMWQFIRQNALTDPAIFLVYGRTNVRIISRQNINLETIERQFIEFAIRSETGIEVGDFRNTNWFRNVTSQNVRTMYENNNEFIFILYDSSQRESEIYVPFLMAAARELNHRAVYAVDVDRNPNYRSHLQSLNVNMGNNYPQVFLIYNDRNSNRSEAVLTPRNLNDARYTIIEFLTNSVIFETPNNSGNQGGGSNNQGQGSIGGGNQNFEDLHHYRFPNTSSFTINERFRLGNNFIVAIYDSSRPETITIAEAIRGAAIAADVTVYAVNLNSSVWSNRNSDALYWLRLARGNNDTSVEFPVMIHFNNYQVQGGGLVEFRQTNPDLALQAAHNFIIRTNVRN
ncbi:MAG: copper amine oxidase N-terminal domain-containing protein [Defluviitaleaceae bacterium]|nr:copper amine oxidase N-terminal domain-containing protein [Defluviitaleaceae bacterium]